MRVLRTILDSIRARRRFERDMRDEIDAHLRDRAADLVRAGLSAADASRRARVEFGAIEAYKEQCRDAGGLAVLRPFLGILSDLRLAGRRLLATPLFLIFAVVSLALGVSVTTTVYSALYAFLWKPIGVRDASQVAVVTTGTGLAWKSAISEPDFDDLRQRQQSFSDLAASMLMGQTIETPRASEIAPVEAVSENYFRALGIGVALGRPIRAGDDVRRL
jgi:hypothetical protein